MPISHKHKVLFLHAPKNAGSSIEEALGIEKSPQALLSHKYTADSIYALQHLPYSQLRKTVPTTVWSTYTKVCVVRNPWDRMVSDWRWRRKNGLPLGQLSFGDFVRCVQMVLSDPDWDGGVSNSGRGEGSGGQRIASEKWRVFEREYRGHFQRQVAYVNPPEGDEDMQGGTNAGQVRILRFENLARDWDRFRRECLGNEGLALTHTNDSGRDVKSHYSDEYEAAVAAEVGAPSRSSLCRHKVSAREEVEAEAEEFC